MLVVAVVSGLAVADAQDKPRYGGELIFLVPSEPPTYDGHAEGTFGVVHPLAPHYNTLLRIDPDRQDRHQAGARPRRVVDDLAGRPHLHAQAAPGREVPRRQRDDLARRQGQLRPDRQSRRRASCRTARATTGSVEAIEAPDANTIRFQLKWPEASFLVTLASPYSWIYKADILAKDQQWYAKNVMGTGPFKFVEHVKGSHWVGKKNPDYWDKGKPYLDGYRAIFITLERRPGGRRPRRARPRPVPRLQPGRARHARERAGPQDHRAGEPVGLRAAGGDEPEPQAVGRPARAQGADAGAGPLAGVEEPVEDHHRARTSPASRCRARRGPRPPAELEKLAGYGRDINASRAEARRLLKEAGIPDGFSFTFKNRGIPHPYEPIGIWLIDQWRQIGLNVKQETIEASAYHPMLKRGDFDVAMDFQCSFVVEPDIDIEKFQSAGISDRNCGRYKDPVLDDLYIKQARATDPEERKRHLRAFEKRLLDEEVRYIYTLQYHRIVAHSSKVRGWTITPAHFLNQQLDTVWLAE